MRLVDVVATEKSTVAGIVVVVAVVAEAALVVDVDVDVVAWV